MKHAEFSRILLRCLAETRLVEAPPAYTRRTVEALVNAARLRAAEFAEHGVRYKPADWFPAETAPHAQQRLLRAVRQLAEAGLLTTSSRWGRKLSHLKLTLAGRRAAEELEAEEKLAAESHSDAETTVSPS